MSVATAVARIAELEQAFQPPQAKAQATTAATAAAVPGTLGIGAGTTLGSSPSFGGLLANATAGLAPIPATGAGNPAMVAIAQREVGVTESPPGSNDAPRIADYRSAVPGASVGPWCAYFVSWVARQAGVPLGDTGGGFGYVPDVRAWAQRAGRWTEASAGVPRPGDLIVWSGHIGMVEGVRPDGSIQTIEGNSSDRVSRRVHPNGDALGYVRMSA